jgi:hypothetical protein
VPPHVPQPVPHPHEPHPHEPQPPQGMPNPVNMHHPSHVIYICGGGACGYDALRKAWDDNAIVNKMSIALLYTQSRKFVKYGEIKNIDPKHNRITMASTYHKQRGFI